MPFRRTSAHSPWTIGIGMGLCLILGILLSPVLIPVMLILETRATLILRRSADTFPCLACQKPLGREALRLADARVSAEMDEFRRMHPRVRYSLAPRTLHAICPACGAEHSWQPAARTFTLQTAAPLPDDLTTSAPPPPDAQPA